MRRLCANELQQRLKRRGIVPILNRLVDVNLRWYLWRRRPKGHHRVSTNQKLAWLVLREAMHVAALNEIEVVVSGGTLLGAVRDSRFAGRPSDVDLRVMGTCEEARNFASILQTSQPHFSYIQEGADRIQLGFFPKLLLTRLLAGSGFLLDIEFTTKDCLKTAWDENSKHVGPVMTDHWTTHDGLVANIFDCQVLVPDQWEEYVQQMYGADWQTPRRASLV